MQPYQSATQEIRRQGEAPLKFAKNAGTVGSAALAIGSLGRILPFLSKYIPEDLAIKGLSKVDPRFGSFIQKAMAAGESFNQVKEHIEEKIEGSGFSSQPSKDSRNLIQQESPALHTFIDQEIRKGRKPIEAAALAQNDKKFSSIIKKLTKAHNTPWSSIIQSVYGTGDTALANTPQSTSEQASSGLDPAVAQILQQGAAILGKFRGQT